MKNLARYAKALVATLGGVLETAVPLIPVDSHTGRVLAIIVAALTALGVYGVPNTPAPVSPGAGGPSAPVHPA